MKKLILGLIVTSLIFLLAVFSKASDISIRINAEKKEYGNVDISMQRVEDVEYSELNIKTIYFRDLVAAEYFLNNDYSKQWIYINLLEVLGWGKVRMSSQWTDFKDTKLMAGFEGKQTFRSLYLVYSYDTNLSGEFVFKNKFGVTVIPQKGLSISPAWSYAAYNEDVKSQFFMEIKLKL